MKHKVTHIALVLAITFIGCNENTGTFRYQKGLLVTHWTGCVAPRYMGISNISHTYGASWFDQEDVRWIADHGFDHLQIDVDEQWWFSSDSAANKQNIETYRRAVQWANELNMGIVLTFDVHPFGPQPDPMSDSVVNRRADQWHQIASLFKSNHDGIRFQLGDNYLPTASDPERRYHAYVDAIRKVDKERFIYINIPVDVHRADSTDIYYSESFSAWLNSAGAIDYNKFDSNTGVSVSYFFPEEFLYQHPHQKQKITFPGTTPDFSLARQDSTFYDGYVDFVKKLPEKQYDESAIQNDLSDLTKRIREKAGDREIYLKQFGIHTTIDSTSAANYTKSVVAAAEGLNVGWCLYDYESGRAIRDEKGNPFPGYWGLGLNKD